MSYSEIADYIQRHVTEVGPIGTQYSTLIMPIESPLYVIFTNLY